MAITIGRRPGAARTEETKEPTRASRYQRGGAAEEEPTSSRRGRGGRDGSSDDAPARGRGRGGRDGGDEDSGRGGRSRGRGREEEAAPARKPQRGWSGSKRTREETSDYADRFKLPEDDFIVIAFMEDEPFDSAGRHFIRELKGQKSFICPGKDGPFKCPLCAAGDRAMAVSYFNIAVLDIDDEGPLDPVVKVWEAGPGYAKDIETQQNSRAVGGKLTSVYFEVRGVKADSGKGATKLKMNVVRERDLESEWHIPPLSEEEFVALEKDMKGEGYVKFSSERAMQAAADELYDLAD